MLHEVDLPTSVFLHSFPFSSNIARIETLTLVELLGRMLVFILSSLSIGKYHNTNQWGRNCKLQCSNSGL